jgi:putative aldouronate transport system permease protein
MSTRVAAELEAPKAPNRSRTFRLGYDRHTQTELQIMIWPAMVFIFIFNFLPLFGLLMAFKNYTPLDGTMGIFTAAWNHFQNFTELFHSVFFWPMIRNTIAINIIGLFVGFPITIGFALLINEVMNRYFRSFVLTITYLPHFLSWVIYGGLLMSILMPGTGPVNILLVDLHLVKQPVQFLANPNYFWGLAVGSGLLKDLGWSAILYLAAIAGVDVSLHEAAALDGAGRFQRMWHVTLPGIMGTVVILLIFAISGILNNNFNQIYVLQNSLNLPTSQVISTYIFETGLEQFQFAFATAVGLMNGVIGVLLLLGANWFSKRVTDQGLF